MSKIKDNPDHLRDADIDTPMIIINGSDTGPFQPIVKEGPSRNN